MATLLSAFRTTPASAQTATRRHLLSPGPPPDELGFHPRGRALAQAGQRRRPWARLVAVAPGSASTRGEALPGPGRSRRPAAHRLPGGRDSARGQGKLGYWEIDREVFEVVVARQDVNRPDRGSEVEYPLDAAMFPGVEPGSGGPRCDREAPVPRAPAGGAGSRAGHRQPPGAAALGRRGGPAPLRVVTRPGPQPDRSSSTPDRMAAWHGFARRRTLGPGPRPDSRVDPGSDPRLDPRSDPRLDPRSDPRLDPRLDPRDRPAAGTRGQQARPDPQGSPAIPRDPRADPRSGPGPPGRGGAAPLRCPAPPGARRAGRRDRVPQSVFAELLSLAAIPHAAYAVDEGDTGPRCA